jgi:hypothetical protein
LKLNEVIDSTVVVVWEQDLATHVEDRRHTADSKAAENSNVMYFATGFERGGTLRSEE